MKPNLDVGVNVHLDDTVGESFLDLVLLRARATVEHEENRLVILGLSEGQGGNEVCCQQLLALSLAEFDQACWGEVDHLQLVKNVTVPFRILSGSLFRQRKGQK